MMLVVINRPEKLVMRAHARSCPVEAVIEPFLKANLSVALLGHSSAELLTDATKGSVSPRRVQDPHKSCEKLVHF
jgi:hypothetical protein